MQTKEFKSTKAVTMISLVLTLIILLILAGVTLNLVVGEDGIIGRTISARERHEDSAEKELIELAVASAMAEGQRELTTENLNTALKEQFGNEEEAKSTSVGWIYNCEKDYMIYRNGKLEEKINNQLPSAIQQVEYIESTGTQYVNTGTKLNQNSEVIIDLQVTTSGKYHIFGSRTSATQNSIHIVFSNQDHFYRADFQDWTTNSLNIEPNYNRYTIQISNKELKIGNEIKKINSYTNFETPSNALIFNVSGYIAPKYTIAKMKLFSCKIFLENVLSRYFIPCYCTETVTDVDGKSCPSGTIGLYDLVEDQFYTNQGTGTFLKGTDV